jgi:hypothetical protein
MLSREKRGFWSRLAQGAALRIMDLCPSADISGMLMRRRDFSPGQLQSITTGTYRRIRLFTGQWFLRELVVVRLSFLPPE